MTQWKCFIPDTPSFCDHIWACVELFGEIGRKMAVVSITIDMDTRPPEKLVMAPWHCEKVDPHVDRMTRNYENSTFVGLR